MYTANLALEYRMKQAKANRLFPREHTGHSKHPLQTTQEKTLHMDISRWSILKSDWLYSLQPDMEKVWWQQWHPTPVLLPGESHRWRSLVGCSPWGCYESDTTDWPHFHFSLSCLGEGNDNPLQYSCLENPRNGGDWWAAVYGVIQSRTRLKRLNSGMEKLYTVSKNKTRSWLWLRSWTLYCQILA